MQLSSTAAQQHSTPWLARAIFASSTQLTCEPPCCCAVQVVDLDNFALLVACSQPVMPPTPPDNYQPPNVSQAQLDEAANWAASQPPKAIASDGSGLSSRPGAPYKLWLDFLGSSITNTGGGQQGHRLM
jgi:hypothetical protein